MRILIPYFVGSLLLWQIPFVSNGQQRDTLDLGYRTMSVHDFNGAAYTITAEELENLPVTNLTNLLSGLVPGLYTIQTSGGTVNESADYWIRGRRTNSEGVLVLVDGQERAFGVLSTREVAHITVVKDASLAALYGTRAANGIILVTTKKGTIGKPSIEITSQLINQQPIGLLEPVNALTYATHYNEAMKADGRDASARYSNAYLNQYRNREGVDAERYPDVNWLGDYFRENSWVQRHNVRVSGGSNRTRYFINGGFLNQNGMFNTDAASSYSTNNATSRYNLRSNLEVDVMPTTVLKLDLYGWYDKQNRPGGDSFSAYEKLVTTPANAFPPYYLSNGQYVDQEGSLVNGIDGRITAGSNLHTNPWALLNRNGYSVLNRMYGSFRAQLTQDFSFITDGLTASATLSMDAFTGAVTNREKAFAFYQRDGANANLLRRTGNDDRMNNGVSSRESDARTSLDFQLSYTRDFGKHALFASGFYNQYEFDNQTSIPSRFQTIGSWVGYHFDHRYYVDLTGSYHGVYKFAPDHRFGFFPTVTAGWAVSNEAFFATLKPAISYLKLRGSYGLVGNQRGVSEFQYQSRLRAIGGVYQFGNAMNNVGGYIEDIIANPGLTWEKSQQLNLGANLHLLDNRLSLVFDYFHDRRHDMYMVNNQVTALLGTTVTINENIGEMYARGYETALSWHASVGNLAYRIGATFSQTDNHIVKTGEIDEPYFWLQNAGFPQDIRTGYTALGLFDSYDEIAASPRQTFSDVHPGDIKYKDINGDGVIDRNDQVPLGYGRVPRIFYGFNGALSYKNIGLTFLFQGAGRATRILENRVAYPFIGDGTIYAHQLDYWTPENRSAALPRISAVHNNVNNTQNSSFWMRDVSYLRLKTVELYYELPSNALKNLFLDNLRITLNGYNLWVWTVEDNPLDPEDTGSSGTMPLTRNMSVGLSVRF
ncbi:SusC/RagA family TonB-linked outer membrane protein [Parapedobacter sp. 10938]|uniref:SusC/RagA family TonB-linked outer membrane protein n=1 Tax=Parapedobacter flavus TaxID=3110225 RepID=UPI002DB68133|nr:SusC/RagA family TonB-linked outer membrane protein [Parapedobacter sp. 10938]MEC3880128.1 SusC/RagA family TonB-linked outer membrane protein [Parapedobacter sp. 10938]